MNCSSSRCFGDTVLAVVTGSYPVETVEASITSLLVRRYRRLVSLVVKVLVYRAGGLGSIPSRTTTQGLKIIFGEKVLPLFQHLQMVRPSRLLG